MRSRIFLSLSMGALWVAAAGAAGAQQPEAAQHETRQSLAVSYPEGSSVEVVMRGSKRHPDALGKARVRRRLGRTEIELKLEEMKPALLFGGDFSTYVFWLVSPEGITINAGEMALKNDKSELITSTPLTTFGMFVTAEPHYLVKVPSQFVVLENSEIGLLRGTVLTDRVEYSGFAAVYRFERESLAGQEKIKGEFRADRQQATIALNLAEKARAGQFAPDEMKKARDSMSETVRAFEQGIEEERLSLLAHRTVRLAVEAQEKSERREREAAIEAERKERLDQIARLETLQAELETSKAQAEAAEAEARAEAERARKERKAALEAKEDAEAAAQQARIEQRQARELLARAEQQSALLEQEKNVAQQEATMLRDRMQNALSKVVETRETARGLIVNLPDILFDSGKATMRPQAKEVLSRVAGILLVAPAYELSIEGHTDSTGSDQLNQKLSERRAESVRDYLIESQVSPELMSTQGFGETQPVDSNDSASGRQKNRRVEIVIQNVDMEGLGAQP